MRRCYIARNGENGIVGAVMFEEKILHVVQRGILHVFGNLPNGGPAIGVYLIGQIRNVVPDIAVGFVQAGFLEFLDDHLALYFQRFFAEIEAQHPVAFQPEGHFEILRWQQVIEIGDVAVGKGIVFPARQLDRIVEVGNIGTATEHQVLEQVRKSRLVRRFVLAADVVEDIDGHHRGAGVLMDKDPQAVRQYKSGIFYHVLALLNEPHGSILLVCSKRAANIKNTDWQSVKKEGKGILIVELLRVRVSLKARPLLYLEIQIKIFISQTTIKVSPATFKQPYSIKI